MHIEKSIMCQIMDLIEHPTSMFGIEEVCRDELNIGLTVTTIRYQDKYYTLVEDKKGKHCVEFYLHKIEARKGHVYHTHKLTKGRFCVVELGFDTVFPFKEITLEPYEVNKNGP